MSVCLSMILEYLLHFTFYLSKDGHQILLRLLFSIMYVLNAQVTRVVRIKTQFIVLKTVFLHPNSHVWKRDNMHIGFVCRIGKF